MGKRLFTILVLLVVTFVFTVPASASSITENPNSLRHIEGEIRKTTEITDSALTKYFTNKAKVLTRDIAEKASGKEKANLHICSDKLVLSEAKLLKYENNNTFNYILTVPVALESSHEFSNVTLFFWAK
ncbi:hypothetical protein [Mesobacillus maritimus]|uniref:DUF3887 domain-containing protein n=1 Tax=Mesobacillus maritimus TaxID=1643336 RepID=A0ABS7K948_9BACI|nr:hypothetical protein [Mesobacillus maritimus]MBY0098794.1 hypothetical protein [Mesobacillus maritimus]